jgi:hypothetical protein
MIARQTAALAASAGLVLSLGALAAAGPASAMGSGDAYEDMQVGVTYTVYEPSYTAGLKAQHIGGNDLCPEGTEENLVGIYGKKSKTQFTIWEGNPMCSDIGVGEKVATATVNGATATVYAYCDPESDDPCTRKSVKEYGGHIDVTLPAGGTGLRKTRVWIETFSAENLSTKKLLRIARSLVPVQGS